MLDVDLLLRQVILGALPALSLGTQIPPDLSDRLPYATAKRIGGPTVHPGLAGMPTVDTQAWAATRKGASDLAWDMHRALIDAWRKQTTYPEGWISSWSCPSEPSEIRPSAFQEGATLPQDLYRFQATYRLVVRSV